MKQRFVVIGQSPFSYFLAEELDRSLGNLVHADLLWLSPSEHLLHLPSVPTLLGRRSLPISSSGFRGLKKSSHAVKSINLKDQRIVTTDEVIGYDYLVLDQIPVYSLRELEAIASQLATLLASLQAGVALKKTPRARIYCQGKTVESWQLALLVHQDIRTHYPKLISQVDILIDRPSGKVGEFLDRSGLKEATAAHLKLPGLTVQAPQSLVSERHARGLQLGSDGRALVDHLFSPIGHPQVVIIDEQSVRAVNLLRLFRSQARALADELVRQGEQGQRQALDFVSPGFLFEGEAGSHLSFGEVESVRARAKLISRLEKQLHRSLGRR